MPKIKTHRGAAKRFRLTKSGKIKHRRSNRAHILTKKAPGRMRKLRKMALVAKQDELSVKRMLVKK
ncbi:MAG: 50S ribosomal protein L35 [Gammaproteobacteria bacterium RIFCSPHIGHO2_12_FULL_41_15]|nr:MAG: 50S ribosomal protein L35 [Gammaproteobacteria bacterium RIFCSPHIGHO2_12_FULL_41_15]